MPSLSRRRFLAQSTAAIGLPLMIPRHVLAGPGKPGANEQVAIGIIGVGGRANMLLDQLPESGRLVALSDCNLPRPADYLERKKVKLPICQDHRKLLERDVDAVIVATGEFQRVLPCIHACQAGKDIYAEKPLTLYVREGRTLVRAVRRYNRVFQVGTQQRSMAINRVACEFVRQGGLGKDLTVEGMNYPNGGIAAAAFPKQPLPPGLDWNVWLNQAAMRPYNEQWMKWGQFREFAGGQTTNWGAHGIDQIQWALGMSESGPIEFWMLDGPGQVAMRYANGVVVKLIRPFGTANGKHGPWGGAVFIGSKGKLEINRNKITSNPKEIAAGLLARLDAAAEEKKWSDKTALWQARWHLQGWIDCIRTRQRPIANVEIGHRTITVCHLVNITRQLHRKLAWDPVKEDFVGDEEASRKLVRPRRKEFELPEV